MNPESSNAWRRDALDLIFEALAASKTLEGKVAYKGARILSKLLGGKHRESYDIDLNLIQRFVDECPDQEKQSEFLHSEISIAVERFVGAQDPVRYQLESVRVVRRPRHNHPMGWDAFEVKIKLEDLSMPGVHGLPALELDIAAPEMLGVKALAPIPIGESTIIAYTLERIAGEKMRAFLSTLPAYRSKFKKPGDAVRAKDIYDLARIYQVRPITDLGFWKTAGKEFRNACESRLVDCTGMESFEEQIDVTRATYTNDAIIPKDVAFEDAWKGLQEIVSLFKDRGIIPFQYPLPESV